MVPNDPTALRPSPRRGPSPIGTADLILAALLQEKAVAVYIDPADNGHAASFETSRGQRTTLPLTGDLGDAVIIRLGLLCGFDVGAARAHLGRIRVRLGTSTGEVLVMISTGGQGLAVELRRILTVGNAPEAGGKQNQAPGDPNTLGPYRLFEELGRGGTGVVYRALHVPLERPVALKILSSDVIRDVRRGALLLREGRAVSRIRHPGIVDVTDFGSTPDGRVFLVMELIPWPTLEKTLLAVRALPPLRAVAITREILKALGATHARGIVHRDLKPSNVFVGPDDRVKLGDFGAASAIDGERPLDGTDEDSPLLGTPQYMAPEHTSGPVDRRSDLYAMGVMLFQMLSGKLPFNGKTPAEVFIQHMEAPIPPVIGPGGPISPGLAAVVQRALAKQIEQRYQRVSDMLADLDKAALGVTRKGWQRWLPA